MQKRNLIEGQLLSIDPTKTNCFDYAIHPRYRWLARPFLENSNPNFAAVLMMNHQPLAQCRGALEDNRICSFVGHASRIAELDINPKRTDDPMEITAAIRVAVREWFNKPSIPEKQ